MSRDLNEEVTCGKQCLAQETSNTESEREMSGMFKAIQGKYIWELSPRPGESTSQVQWYFPGESTQFLSYLGDHEV
jgi:hypothetical protein